MSLPPLTKEEWAERTNRAAQDARKAKQDHDAEAARVEANTARLKALRLERDRLVVETGEPTAGRKLVRPAAKKPIRRNVPLR